MEVLVKTLTSVGSLQYENFLKSGTFAELEETTWST